MTSLPHGAWHLLTWTALSTLIFATVSPSQTRGESARVIARLYSNYPKVTFREKVTLILVTPRKGQKTVQIIEASRWRDFRWQVPPQFCDGKRFQWYLVRGMTDPAKANSFFDRPMDWSWATGSCEIQQGKTKRLPLRSIPAHATVLGKGTILDPGGKPIRRLQARILYRPPGSRVSHPIDSTAFSYHPLTGRYWVMGSSPHAYPSIELNLSTDCSPGEGMARLLGVPMDSKEDVELTMWPEAILTQRMHGWDPRGGMELQASLRFLEGSKFTDGPRPITDPSLQFVGLPGGRYELVISTRFQAQTLLRHSIQLRGAEHAAPENAIDLTKHLMHVTIRVKDIQGHPIPFWAHHLVPAGTSSKIRKDGWITPAGGTCRRQIPKSGADFLIEQPSYAPRVIWDVKTDREVTLYRPRQVRVLIRGLPKDPALREHLFVRAEPTTGFPSWAWWALTRNRYYHKDKKQTRNLIREFACDLRYKTYCRSPVDENGMAELYLTHPGRWRFQLLYSLGSEQTLVPLAEVPSIKVDKARHALRIKVRELDLQEAREQFLKKDPRKGR